MTRPELNLPQIARHLGLELDPWQLDVLENPRPRLLLNCSRQAGKSTIVALAALLHMMIEPLSKVLLLSRSERQATELFRTLVRFYERLGKRHLVKQTRSELVLANDSRVLCLPCREDTIRGFSAISLLVIDEAARVPDNLYRAVRPMLAVSQGRIICLSTPFGKRGFFYREWAHGGHTPSPSVGEGRGHTPSPSVGRAGEGDWHRIEIPATKCPRIPQKFLEAERRSLGDSWFRQEYLCSFEAQEGLVFPGLRRCLVDKLPPHLEHFPELAAHSQPKQRFPGEPDYYDYRDDPPPYRFVGGLDFGFRNPFAAVWGAIDRDDILWLTGEHYAAEQPIAFHAARLPKGFVWYADPSGASDIAELIRAGFCVKHGVNAIREGIAAVTHRINTDRLKILHGRCPNLLREADLYRYPSASKKTQSGEPTEDDETVNSENPIDAHNHALAALRYTIARLDKNRQITLPPLPPPPPPTPPREDDDHHPAWSHAA
ncbi:MAG: terminase large subunit [Gemmataceae bacterium]